MNTDKLEEQVDLKCPSCGGIEFDLDAETEATDEAALEDPNAEPAPETLLQCAQCGKEITYGELVSSNAESIEQHVHAIGEDFAEELKQNLLDAVKKMKPQ